jgi:uncharacterized protein YjiS (DUF1127 family)
MHGQVCGKALVAGLQRDRRPSSLLRRLDKALGAAFDRLLDWHARASSRRTLRGLDERMLRDIGIDRGVAEQEGTTPFWR